MDLRVNNQGGLNSLCVDDINSIQDGCKTSTQNSDDFFKEYPKKDVDKAVDNFNKLFEQEKTHAEISFHDKFNTIMVKIIDDNSGDVLMEVPPKKILDMVAKMCELSGVVFDKTV